MKYARLWWDAAYGWVVDVPNTALQQHQIKAIVDWALPRQIDRLKGMPMGPKRDQFVLALEDLKQYKVNQHVQDHDNDGVISPFASTERTGTKVITYG
jgi:hypothetical protein